MGGEDVEEDGGGVVEGGAKVGAGGEHEPCIVIQMFMFNMSY